MKKFLLYGIIFVLSALNLLAEGRNIEMKQGTSKIIKFDDAKKVDVIKGEVASGTIISDSEVMLDGKKEGTGVLNIYSKSGVVETIVVNVKKASRSERMVELDVQVLEIASTDGADYGIDWPTLIGPNASASSDSSSTGTSPLGPLNLVEQSPPLLAFGKFQRGAVNLFLDFMVKNNYAKMLAKPKLLTVSGKKAKFLSGGEIPIVNQDTQGRTSVEWKQYGVSLEIEPEIIKDDNIRADIKAEVSNLDYSNAVKIGIGGVMPAVNTRWASTTISVAPEDTMVIAGMIENQDIKVTSGVPVLSGIPLLGELFKNTHTENQKTELVIFVTSKIVETGSI
jgi:pilus assembly protein CpaC